MRKKASLTSVYLMLFFALSACGGGTSGGNSGNPAQDTITLTVSGPTGTITTTYIEGTHNSQGELDPNMMSYVTALNETHIQFLSGKPWTSGSSGFVLVVNDNKEQAYLTGGFPYDGYIDYDFFDQNNNHYTSLYSTESGTITLLSIGTVDEQITGTFSIPVSNPTNTSDTLRLSGSFRVTRIAP